MGLDAMEMRSLPWALSLAMRLGDVVFLLSLKAFDSSSIIDGHRMLKLSTMLKECVRFLIKIAIAIYGPKVY
jgi:hypothetical protein